MKDKKGLENNPTDTAKVRKDMEALKAKIIEELKRDIYLARLDEEELSKLFKIKHLDKKIELTNERGEQIESDWYVAIVQVGGQLQITYYDENQNVLGIQESWEEPIRPTNRALKETEKGFEKAKALENLKQEDIQKAKTLEQLQEQQMEQEQHGPQLTLEQANRLSGPKISLNQNKVDGDIPLGNKIGIEGDYIQFVDINEAKKLNPDLEVAELGQQFIPIVISNSGETKRSKCCN